MTEQMIAKLANLGNRWTKNGNDRVYIDVKTLGLVVETYKTGSISYAEFGGKAISNSLAKDLLSHTVYVDLNDGSIHILNKYTNTGAETLRRAVADLLDELEEEIAAEEAAAEEAAAETETTENEEDENMTIETIRTMSLEALTEIVNKAAADRFIDAPDACDYYTAEAAAEELAMMGDAETDPAQYAEEMNVYIAWYRLTNGLAA